MHDILVKNVRLFPDEASLRDIAVEGGRFVTVAENIREPAVTVIDAAGQLGVPGFVDAHTHLDKALLMNRIANPSGTLKEAITNMNAYLASAGEEDFIERGAAALEMAVGNGTTFMRSHIAINPDLGLKAFNAAVTLRDRFADRLQLDIVAFPTAGYALTQPYLDLIEDALSKGAGTLGGSPTLMGEARGFIDAMFGIAGRRGCPLDFHVDESDNPNVDALEYLAEKTIACGYEGRVTAGHCTALSVVDDATAARVVAKVRAAGISVVVLASANLYLMGRNTGHPRRRGITRVDELLASGVNVVAASDNLRDPFRPFGNFDLLEEALLTAQVAQMGGVTDFPALLSMVTYNAARALGLEAYGFGIGCPANLTLLAASSSAEAIISQASKRCVIQAGRFVSLQA